MEGFFTALLFSGAAVVAARGDETRPSRVRSAMRALLMLVGLSSLVALTLGFLLYEWLTVSWAFGLCSCCLALCVRLGWESWSQRVWTVVVLTLSTIGAIICIEGLAPNAPWVISQAVAHVSYRTGAPVAVLGNGLLNLTALLLAIQRMR
jgi:hypothetical protein